MEPYILMTLHARGARLLALLLIIATVVTSAMLATADQASAQTCEVDPRLCLVVTEPKPQKPAPPPPAPTRAVRGASAATKVAKVAKAARALTSLTPVGIATNVVAAIVEVTTGVDPYETAVRALGRRIRHPSGWEVRSGQADPTVYARFSALTTTVPTSSPPRPSLSKSEREELADWLAD